MLKESIELLEEEGTNHWWFRVRYDLLRKLVENYCYNKVDLKILDLGCGAGYHSKILEKYGEVFSLDASETAVDFCRQKGLKHVVQGQADHLPFESEQFDLVVILDVLEHLEDDAKAVAEIKRVLKKNGVVISFVPAFSFLWSAHDERVIHKRRYVRAQLEKLMSVGFTCLKISYFNFFLLPFIFLFHFFEKIFRIVPKEESTKKLLILNPLFYLIFRSELLLLPKFSFPWGVSLLGVFKKTE